jgi:hypothetical protein
MGLMDSLRKIFPSQGGMRDRHADREAGRDPTDPAHNPPSGDVGPAGSALKDAQGAGGAIAPDPTDDR